MKRVAVSVTLLVLFGGCTKAAPTEEELAVVRAQAQTLAGELAASPADGASTAGDAIVVRLAFGPEADLDLYVTDPLLDTAYFARHETRTGGVISKDVRCDTAGPRIEEVRFPQAWPGRYRVGVDFPRRCDGERPPAPAAYAVSVDVSGETYSANGLVDLEYFEVIVLEFEVAEGES